jgi:hypothetical protein
MKKILAVFCIVMLGSSYASAELKGDSVRNQITGALSKEIPEARRYFGTDKLASAVNESLIGDETFLKLAEVVVAQTNRDKLFSSSGMSLPNGEVGVSISSLPLEDGDWKQALIKFQGAAFDKLVQHYSGQAAGTGLISFVHIYLGIEKTGNIIAVIGLSDLKDEKRLLAPRQFVGLQAPPRSPVSLNDLPSKRCDVDTQGEIIPPGGGYLLNAHDVAGSEQYWSSLSPSTRALMRQVIEKDKSPWLVSEKHIGKFNVDKSEARRRAVEMWNNELQAAAR